MLLRPEHLKNGMALVVAWSGAHGTYHLDDGEIVTG